METIVQYCTEKIPPYTQIQSNNNKNKIMVYKKY